MCWQYSRQRIFCCIVEMFVMFFISDMDHIFYLLSFFAFSFYMIPQEKRFGNQSPPNILLLKSAWLTLCLSTEVRNAPQILILFRCLQHMLVSVLSFILTGSVGKDSLLWYCMDSGMGNFCLPMGQAIVGYWSTSLPKMYITKEESLALLLKHQQMSER